MVMFGIKLKIVLFEVFCNLNYFSISLHVLLRTKNIVIDISFGNIYIRYNIHLIQENITILLGLNTSVKQPI